MNKVFIIGHLGADPELRQTQSSSFVSLRVATDDGYYDKQKNWVSRVNWHNVIHWGSENSDLSKGDKVLIEGSITYNSYEKDGVTKYVTNINAKKIFKIDKNENRQAKESNTGDWRKDGNVGYPWN